MLWFDWINRVATHWASRCYQYNIDVSLKCNSVEDILRKMFIATYVDVLMWISIMSEWYISYLKCKKTKNVSFLIFLSVSIP